jgi:hypothetical protein
MLALRCEEFASQLTAYIGILNPARRPQSRKGRLAADALRQRRDGVKEGGSVKSQELILCKYKICVVSMKIIIGRCYVNFFTGLLCAEN